MQDVTETAEPLLDIWPYVEAISPADLEGYEAQFEFVEHVYRDASSRFDQVLVPTNKAEVFLVIVVDLKAVKVYGHHLLNLPELYNIA
ncbi:hypothetical protein LRS06_04070 [Hymenobacter sp. J193]|uniref:hypothetical protein n=1 Tax=Hymenobacter sp. J193 TaxID=2898429 RepID=UPI0021514D76|nr:hypothetical protein [Hymenobacter sp. J193]MCR5886964.1 hypothetical protein [Hymenobacter sp. J193]